MAVLSFVQTLNPLSTAFQNQQVPMDGTISEIVVDFPDGTNGLVSIDVFHNTKQLLPLQNTLALNNTTPTFQFNEKVRLGDNIRVDWTNSDSTYAHTVTITVNIIDSPELPQQPSLTAQSLSSSQPSYTAIPPIMTSGLGMDLNFAMVALVGIISLLALVSIIAVVYKRKR